MPLIATLTLNPSLDEWIQLPSLKLGQLNRAISFNRYPGGKGINVSRVAHELRHETVAVGLAGGYDGRLLSHLLDQHGIPHRFIAIRGSTRNNYQLQTKRPAAITQVNSPGPTASAASLREVLTALRRMRRRARAFVLSGSLPPGAPLDTYARVLRALRPTNAFTVLDSSGPALRMGLAGAPRLIKPNREEAEELLGRRLRTRRALIAAAEELTRQAAFVVLSAGGDGAAVAVRSPRAVYWAVPPKVTPHSTVGAGDSLVAGFVVSWLSRRSVVEAIRLGIACGAAAAMTSGTELCHRADVLRLRPRVHIERVAG